MKLSLKETKVFFSEKKSLLFYLGFPPPGMFPPVLFPGLVRPAVDQQLQVANAEGKKETNLEGDNGEKETSADENSPDDLANSSGIIDGSLLLFVHVTIVFMNFLVVTTVFVCPYSGSEINLFRQAPTGN